MLTEFHIGEPNGARTESLGNIFPTLILCLWLLLASLHTEEERPAAGIVGESDAREGTLTLRPPPCKRIPPNLYRFTLLFSVFPFPTEQRLRCTELLHWPT